MNGSKKSILIGTTRRSVLQRLKSVLNVLSKNLDLKLFLQNCSSKTFGSSSSKVWHSNASVLRSVLFGTEIPESKRELRGSALRAVPLGYPNDTKNRNWSVQNNLASLDVEGCSREFRGSLSFRNKAAISGCSLKHCYAFVVNYFRKLRPFRTSSLQSQAQLRSLVCSPLERTGYETHCETLKLRNH